MFTASLQSDGEKLFNLLDIEGLSAQILQNLLSKAATYVKKGLTTTRTTFEMAAKALSANVINFDVQTSATSKGESLLDTIYNLEAMGCDLFVVRHSASGTSEFIAKHLNNRVPIINAGDGCHAHPTQALLDMLTIQNNKGQINGLTYAIVGDIKHSRVARSEIQALNMLGAKEVRVVAPKTLLPEHIETWGAHIYQDMDKALKNVDVIIMLRLQKERMQQALIPSSAEYFSQYGLTQTRLAIANNNAIVMHPGPINRNIEIASDIVDSQHAVILEQVAMGKAIRMAVMQQLIFNRQT